MSTPLLRLLGLGYGLATAAGVGLFAAGAPLWIGLLCTWLGGAALVLLLGALIASRSDPAPTVLRGFAGIGDGERSSPKGMANPSL
ncbi:MAG: hypothetical protein AAGD08_02810 [Pseudomonadota bacterium]